MEKPYSKRTRLYHKFKVGDRIRFPLGTIRTIEEVYIYKASDNTASLHYRFNKLNRYTTTDSTHHIDKKCVLVED